MKKKEICSEKHDGHFKIMKWDDYPTATNSMIMGIWR